MYVLERNFLNKKYYYLFVKERRRNNKKEEKGKKGKKGKFSMISFKNKCTIYELILTSLTLFFYLTLCFSRLYLGMHTLDEILLGFVFGLYSHFFFNIWIEDKLKQGLEYLKGRTYNRCKAFIICLFIHICLLSVGVV